MIQSKVFLNCTSDNQICFFLLLRKVPSDSKTINLYPHAQIKHHPTVVMFTAFIFQTILKNVQMNMRHKRDQQQFDETSKCQFRNSETQNSKLSVSFPDFTIIKCPTAPTWNPNYFKPHHMNREAEKFIKHTLMQ